jgi:hypothetical protein
MTPMDVRFINPPNTPELYADYVIARLDAGNVYLRFYRRRPMLRPVYRVAEDGRVVGFEDERQEFEGILQASLTLPLYAAYHLLESLDSLGVKSIIMGEENQDFFLVPKSKAT